MKVDEVLVLDGTIRSVLAGTRFRLELPSTHIVLAHISGRRRKRFIHLAEGAR
jgi:translation initiation factor IF-1